MVQGAYRTAKEDFRDMLKILTRNTPEPIRVSAIMDRPSDPSPGVESHLSSHRELESAVAFLMRAAWLLEPAEVKFDIMRLLFNQVERSYAAAYCIKYPVANVRCLLIGSVPAHVTT